MGQKKYSSHAWYGYGDDADGGASIIYWPVEMDWPDQSFEVVAEASNGICVTYVSDIDMRLELGLGPEVDSTISFANPAVTLPAEKSQGTKRPYTNMGKKVVVSWSDFKQPSWYDGSVKFDGETAAKQLVAVKFVLQEEPGEYARGAIEGAASTISLASLDAGTYLARVVGKSVDFTNKIVLK